MTIRSPQKSVLEGVAAWMPSLMRPILGFRRSYLPLLMVYFAYGALGIIDVSRDMWIKERLTLTAADLAGIGVWLSLPWTVKMVFGQLVDSVPIFGSQRRSYILIGAVFTACGMLTLAGAAGGWIAFSQADHLYILGAMLIVTGTVIQDVVADAMSTEVVSRVDPAELLARRTRSGPNWAWFRSSAALHWALESFRSPDYPDGSLKSSPARPCFCSASSFPPSRPSACC